MDCAVVLTRRPEALRAAFSLVPEYLRVDEDVVSLNEFTVPLGRRFRALKLWTVLRCYGADGLRALIREHVRLADLFAGWVEAEPGWEVAAPHPFSLVCFRLAGEDAANELLMNRVNAAGEIFLSHTKLDGRFVLRLAIGNARTTEDDVRFAWDVLRREAASRSEAALRGYRIGGRLDEPNLRWPFGSSRSASSPVSSHRSSGSAAGSSSSRCSSDCSRSTPTARPRPHSARF